MSSSKVVSILLTNHFKPLLDQCQKTNAEVEYLSKVPYVSVVGCLMHVMVCPRLDLVCGQVNFQVLEGNNGSWYNV